jgi:hypothetical protein
MLEFDFAVSSTSPGPVGVIARRRQGRRQRRRKESSMPRVPVNNLRINTPVEGAAPDATLVVEIDAAHTLPVGPHTFQLEVVDNSGLRSAPVTVRVVVTDNQAPTAIISAPRTVAFGSSITLSGAESTDVGGGSIVRYIWTRLD